MIIKAGSPLNNRRNSTNNNNITFKAKMPLAIPNDQVLIKKVVKELEQEVLHIGEGITERIKVPGINAYEKAVIKDCVSTESTYVVNNAKLSGGENKGLTLINQGQATNTKAQYASLYENAKLENSTIEEEVRVYDFSSLKNVRAQTIIIDGWFSSLKGKNKCEKLEAPFVWRLLHLNFKKSLS